MPIGKVTFMRLGTAVVLVAALGACQGSPGSGGRTPQTNPAPSVTPTPSATSGESPRDLLGNSPAGSATGELLLGALFEIGDLTVQSAQAAPFTPSDVGAGVTGVVAGNINVAVDFSVRNDGSGAYDPNGFDVSAATSAPCSPVFDSMKGVGGSNPPLPAGETRNINTAFSCPGSSGDALTVQVSSGSGSPVTLIGAVP